MENPLVLTFDIGTQSARCLLADRNGNFSDVCQVKYDEPYYSRSPGWAEQRPDFYFDRMVEVAREVTARNGEKMADVIAVTLTAIRDTTLCLDEDNNPLRDIVLWLDKRKAEYDTPYPFWKSLVFKLAGMEDTTKEQYKASVCNWIMQNEKEIWEKTKKFVMLPTYLNYRMTGNLVDSAANMIGHIPFDSKKREWQQKNSLGRCVYDIPAEKLCTLKKSGEIIGYISDDFSSVTGIPVGLPLIATGSDKGCETLGLSVVTEDKAAISFGTTATIQLATKKYFEPQAFVPAYPAVPNDLYNPEIQIYRGFWLLSWFVKEFGAEERAKAKELGCTPEHILDECLDRIPVGSDGLLVQPYWTPGIKHPNSLGAVLGFSDFHTHYHLYKAIVEGLNLELYHSLNKMERRSGMKIKEIYIGGGGAKSDAVCRITADVFGLPVKRIQTHEACSLGSSMAAFVAMGVFANYDEAIKSMVHEKDVFMPREKEHTIYMQLYSGAYSKIYRRLSPINKKINKIFKRR